MVDWSPEACSLCGGETAVDELVNCESWAGRLHSACQHTACIRCVQDHLSVWAGKCEIERYLRVPCFAPGCNKVLPQTLVITLSAEARAVASGIDVEARGGRLRYRVPHECAVCGNTAMLKDNLECGHFSCVACWAAEATEKWNSLDHRAEVPLACRHPGCGARACPKALFGEMPFNHTLELCVKMREEACAKLAHWGASAFRGADDEPGPVCPICRERKLALLRADHQNACANHVACEECWVTWAEGHLERCLDEKGIVLQCMGCGNGPCCELVSSDLWELLCQRSADVSAVDARLKRRAKLQENELFPAAMQVDCPMEGCLGLGYLGYETVMCFVCEHQWNPTEEPTLSAATNEENIMGLGVKQCPKCQEYIEKNGGCDHMTCRCKFEFFWTTLKPYR